MNRFQTYIHPTIENWHELVELQRWQNRTGQLTLWLDSPSYPNVFAFARNDGGQIFALVGAFTPTALIELDADEVIGITYSEFRPEFNWDFELEFVVDLTVNLRVTRWHDPRELEKCRQWWAATGFIRMKRDSSAQIHERPYSLDVTAGVSGYGDVDLPMAMRLNKMHQDVIQVLIYLESHVMSRRLEMKNSLYTWDETRNCWSF